MIKTIGFTALAVYMLLVAMATTIPSLLIPNLLMAVLGYTAGFGILWGTLISREGKE